MMNNQVVGGTVTLEVKRDFDRARNINKNIIVTPEAEEQLTKAKDEDILALTITVDSPPTVKKVEIINENNPEIFYNLAFSNNKK